MIIFPETSVETIIMETLCEHRRVVLGLLTSDEKKHLHVFRVIDCLKTFYDRQNEMKYFYHCKKFLHFLDFEKLFQKIVYAILVFGILYININLYYKEYDKFLLLIYLFD